MSVKVENVEKNVVQLEIEVDAEKFEQAMEKAFLKNAKKFNIPGFRRGKAPRKIIERYYGESVFYEDAINFVYPEAYDKAVSENNLQPVDRPEIDIKQVGQGQNLIFTAKVTVKPEVELGEYKDVEVAEVKVEVTDDDVEQELKKTADKNSRIITIEDRPVQSGDIAVIDFEGFIDGVAFEGGKGTDFELVIGSGQFIPGFEDQLIGANLDEEKDVNVTFPENYSKEELSGKPALFKVKIKGIKVKELPEIDDEFAKDVSEFDTLEEYKADIKKKLTESAEQRAKHELEENVIQKVVENATVDIPEVMIERAIDNLMADFSMRFRYQNIDMSGFREQFREMAENNVKTQLVMEKIASVEEISAEEQEIEEEIKKYAESYGKNEEDFRKQISPDAIEYIKDNIVFRKTIDFLVNNAKISK